MVLSCRSGFLDSVLGLNRSQHLTLLTRRLYHCLADHTLVQVHTLHSLQSYSVFKSNTQATYPLKHFVTCLKIAPHVLLQLRGSMLALALITLELETCCPDWLALTIDLLRKAQVPGWLSLATAIKKNKEKCRWGSSTKITFCFCVGITVSTQESSLK